MSASREAMESDKQIAKLVGEAVGASVVPSRVSRNSQDEARFTEGATKGAEEGALVLLMGLRAGGILEDRIDERRLGEGLLGVLQASER